MLLDYTLSTQKHRRIALALIISVGVAFIVINEAGYRQAVDGMAESADLLATRTALRRLHVQMLAAETGQRGYLLTHRREYLEPYERASVLIASQLVAVREAFAQRPDAAGRVQQIETLVQAKVSEMRTSLELFDSGRVEAAMELLGAGIGREQMKAFEQLLDKMIKEEQDISAANERGLYRSLANNRIRVTALVIISLLLLMLYVRQAGRIETERARQQELLKAEHDRLDEEVKRRTGDVVRIARYLQTAQEDERSRLARELHDELGGLLTAAKLDVARVKSRLKEAPPELNERIVHLVKSLDAGIALKRRIIEDLRPSTLSNLGLKVALEVLCDEFARRSDLAVQHELAELPLADDVQLTIYRLVQEGLTNIAKYAKARSVQVQLRPVGGWADVVVQDDGIGFDVAAVSPASRGLVGMRFRVESSGGSLDISAQAGQGARIHARLPMPATA